MKSWEFVGAGRFFNRVGAGRYLFAPPPLKQRQSSDKRLKQKTTTGTIKRQQRHVRHGSLTIKEAHIATLWPYSP